MKPKILDSEMLDRDQERERIRQYRENQISELPPGMLKSLAAVESSSGKNIKHSPVQGKIHQGSRAGGSFGIMPQTAIEEIRRSPELLERFPVLKSSLDDKALITEAINNDPEMDVELAKKILERKAGRLAKDAKDLDAETAYSWHHGLQGALNRRKQGGIEEDPYTKSVLAELVKARLKNTASE